MDLNIDNISEWFLNQNLTREQIYAYKSGRNFIERETEKAVLIKVCNDFGDFKFWCPKKVLTGESKPVDIENLKQNNPGMTFIKIGEKVFVKEILIKNPEKIKQLGLTVQEVEAMN